MAGLKYIMCKAAEEAELAERAAQVHHVQGDRGGPAAELAG